MSTTYANKDYAPLCLGGTGDPIWLQACSLRDKAWRCVAGRLVWSRRGALVDCVAPSRWLASRPTRTRDTHGHLVLTLYRAQNVLFPRVHCVERGELQMCEEKCANSCFSSCVLHFITFVARSDIGCRSGGGPSSSATGSVTANIPEDIIANEVDTIDSFIHKLTFLNELTFLNVKQSEEPRQPESESNLENRLLIR